jgi:hypothetical protein
VTVDAVAGGDGDHGVFEPFVDATRNGFRVGQTALGVPPIVASIGVAEAPCLTNPVQMTWCATACAGRSP